MKPANAKARDLLAKLQRLADPANGGTPDECRAAQEKADRLKRKLDFNAPAPAMTGDLFAGKFRQGSKAVFIATIPERDIASHVKWAIEHATNIPCLFVGDTIMAHISPSQADKLTVIASTVHEGFRAILSRFDLVDGVTTSDRAAFRMGLYDGMMNEKREAGQRLPARKENGVREVRAKKSAVATAPKFAVHPYSMAVPLGKQIRFSVPLEEIILELEQRITPQIA